MDPLVQALSKTIEKLHTDIVKAVEPLDDAGMNWKHPALSNTPGILLRHIAGSEREWIGERVGGRPQHRDRAKEFTHEALRKALLLAGLRAAHALVQEVVAGLSVEDLAQEIEIPGSERNPPRRVTKAWVVLHSVQHTAYHLGQLQLFQKMAAPNHSPRSGSGQAGR